LGISSDNSERAARKAAPADAAVAHAAWTAERRAYRDLRRQKRESFWTEKVRSEKSCPSELWRSVNELMSRGSSPASSTIIAAFTGSRTTKLPVYVRRRTGQRRHSTQLQRRVARCTSSASWPLTTLSLLSASCLTSSLRLTRCRRAWWSSTWTCSHRFWQRFLTGRCLLVSCRPCLRQRTLHLGWRSLI